jgi:hypothetical protein
MLENVPECPCCTNEQQLFPTVVEEFPTLPEGMELFCCLECENFWVREHTATEYKLTRVLEGYYFESDLPWFE